MNIKYISLFSLLCVAGANSGPIHTKKTKKTYQSMAAFDNVATFERSESQALQSMQYDYAKGCTETSSRTNRIIIQKIYNAYDQSFENLKAYNQDDKPNQQLFEALYRHSCLKQMVNQIENRYFPDLNQSLHSGLYNAFHEHGGNQGTQEDSKGRECSKEACSLIPFFVCSPTPSMSPMMLEIKDSDIYTSNTKKIEMFDRVHAECMQLFDPEGLQERQVKQSELRDQYKYGPKR